MVSCLCPYRHLLVKVVLLPVSPGVLVSVVSAAVLQRVHRAVAVALVAPDVPLLLQQELDVRLVADVAVAGRREVEAVQQAYVAPQL